jgi:hypothetical protein
MLVIHQKQKQKQKQKLQMNITMRTPLKKVESHGTQRSYSQHFNNTYAIESTHHGGIL